ncbi:MAG: CHAT domain-containing protein, partial [Rhodanobacteraceae bacterium]
VQDSLAEGQSLLVFFTAVRYTYAFLLSKDKYTYWEVKPPIKKFQTDVAKLLTGWGNFEQNKELKLDDLSDKWRAPARDIMSALVKSSKADFTKTLDELVIVPDGMLWYIPFEALPVSEGDRSESLIDKVRVRYAPTVGLAVGDARRRKPGGNMAVVLGRLFPRDDAPIIDMGFQDIARAIPEATAIRGKLPVGGALYSSLFDRLIVLSEIAPSAPGYDWRTWQTAGNTVGGTLGQWFSLPFGGPEQVILPGFRTPAERGLNKFPKELAGQELFLATCGLMATGARTVLISRWRTGGQTSIDLMREFAQELPHTTASDAWQRSVQLISHTEVNAAAEPRLK